jgi:hypothetical protein
MTSEPLSYKLDKSSVPKAILGCSLFLLAGVWVLFFPSKPPPVLEQVVMVPVTALLAVTIIFCFKQLLRFSPVIEFLDSGLKWNLSFMNGGFVRWEEIKSAQCLCYGGTWFVNLDLENLDAFVARQPFLRRMIHKLMIKYHWPVSPASVPGTGIIGGSAETIAKQIRKRIPS